MLNSGFHWLMIVIDVSLKSALLATAALLALKLLRVHNSSVRHRVWTGVMFGMLALPILSRLVPPIPLPLSVDADWLAVLEDHSAANVTDPVTSPATRLPREAGQGLATSDSPSSPLPDVPVYGMTAIGNDADLDSANPPVAVVPNGAVTDDPSAAAGMDAVSTARQAMIEESVATNTPWWRRSLRRLPMTLAALWVAGLAVMLLRLLYGVGATCRIADAARPIPRVAGGTPETNVRESNQIRVPVTVGLFRPCILLPAEWQTWPTDKLQAVMTHETAHVERRDFAFAVVAEVNRCLYWFHPLSWWLRAQLLDLAEEACDDAAIGQTGDPAGYAKHLLEVAATLSHGGGRVCRPGLSMARQSNVEGRIRVILDLTRPLSERLTWRATAAIAVVMLPAIAVAAALRPAVQEQTGIGVPAPESQSDSRPSGADQASASKGDGEHPPRNRTNDPQAERVTEDLTLSGVVSASSRLPSELKIDVRRVRERLAYGMPDTSVLLTRAPVDAAGRFAVTIPADQLPNGRNWNHEWLSLQVKADGYGFTAFNIHDAGRTGSIDLRLPPEQIVEGRVLNLEGQPVADAELQVIGVTGNTTESMNTWLEHVRKHRGKRETPGMLQAMSVFDQDIYLEGDTRPKLEPTWFRIPIETFAVVRTDANGRFRIRNIGVDQMLDVRVSGPGIAKDVVSVIARPISGVFAPGMGYLGNGRFHGAKFDYVAAQSTPVRGVVRDIESRQPIAGALVTVTGTAGSGVSLNDWLTAVTDQDGHYELRGLPTAISHNSLPNRIRVIPNNNPYLATEFRLPSSTSSDTIKFDAELRRAVLATGTLTDAETGEPVQGSLNYTPFIGNPANADYPRYSDEIRRHLLFDRHHHTDENGRFQIPVIPGRGLLGVVCDDNIYRAAAGLAAIPEFNGSKQSNITSDVLPPQDTHAVRAIDVPADNEHFEVDLQVDPGMSVDVRFVDPNDSPVRKPLTVHGVDPRVFGTADTTDGTVTVLGLAPGQTRIIWAHTDDKSLNAVAKISADNSRQTVTLAPLTKVTGRMVGVKGRNLRHWHVTAVVPNNRYFGLVTPTKTDDAGRFALRVPVGGPFHLQTARAQNRPLTVKRGLMIHASGQELGVVSLADDRRNAAAAGTSGDQQQNNAAASGADVRTSAASASTSENADEPSSRPLHIHGQVVDNSGNGIAAARVRLYRTRGREFFGGSLRSELVAELPVDATGQFDQSIARRKLPPRDGDEQWTYNDWLMLVVSAPGHVYATRSFPKYGETDALRVRLRPDVAIRGRLLGLEGQPRPGIHVQVTDCDIADTKKLDEWMTRVAGDRSGKQESVQTRSSAERIPVKRDLKLPLEAVPPAVTNDNGEFVLRGFGNDHLLSLRLESPDIVTTNISVVGRRSDEESTAINSQKLAGRFHPRNFIAITQPGAAVFGVIRDAETKRPLPGIRVGATQMLGTGYMVSGYLMTVTDDQGRYRLNGMPIVPQGSRKVNHLGVWPGPRPYILNQDIGIPRNKGVAPVEFDIELQRGVLVKGRLIDRESGLPVQGRVYYSPFRGNPDIARFRRYADGITTVLGNGSQYRTNADGEFAIPVIPGRGVLCAKADDGQYVTSFGLDTIPEFREGTIQDGDTVTSDGFVPSLFHAMRAIEVDDSAETFRADLHVTRGRSMTVRFVDEDNQPLSGVRCSGLTSDRRWATVSGETGTIVGLQTNRIRPVFAVHDERKLKLLTRFIPADGQNEVTLQLRRTAVISGRLVDPDGGPLADLPVFAHYQVNPEIGSSISSNSNTDADGRFKLFLPVGTKYQIVGQARRSFTVVSDLDITKPVRIDYGELEFDPSDENRTAVAKSQPVMSKR